MCTYVLICSNPNKKSRHRHFGFLVSKKRSDNHKMHLRNVSKLAHFQKITRDKGCKSFGTLYVKEGGLGLGKRLLSGFGWAAPPRGGPS